MVTVWYRGKAKINSLLGKMPPEACTADESTNRLPYEIVEMITAHIIHDLDALKTCSLICRSWYIAAVPHIHHTLVLRENGPGTTRNELKPLSKLHELGLIPLVKEIRVKQGYGTRHWFTPQAFGRRDLRYFSAFTNVQTLKLSRLEIYRFIPDIKRYFGHFAPTLRSIILSQPWCTPRQLSHFLTLFSNLKSITVAGFVAHTPKTTNADTDLVPLSAPKLRERLALYHPCPVEVLTQLITSCGGLWFRHISLHGATGCAHILLEACAETLETLRFYPLDSPFSKEFSMGLPTDSS